VLALALPVPKQGNTFRSNFGPVPVFKLLRTQQKLPYLMAFAPDNWRQTALFRCE
jgi:hypothetical protein